MCNIISLGHVKLWKDTNDIVFFQFNNDDSNQVLDQKTAKRIVKVISKLCDGQPMPFVFDLRGFRGTFSTEAASVISKSRVLSKLRISETYILNSIGAKLLIASYKRIYDPVTPHFVSSDLELAEKFCKDSKKMFYLNN